MQDLPISEPLTSSTDNQSQTAPTPPPPERVENSTDATRGEPLAIRAQKRRLELEQALAALPLEDTRARNDLEIAMSTIDSLLTGDNEHLSSTTAADLSRLLENSKHLAETAPTVAE